MTSDYFRPQNRLLALEQELQSRRQTSGTTQPAHRLPQERQNEPIRTPTEPHPTPATPVTSQTPPAPPQRPAKPRTVAPPAMPLPTSSWQTLANQIIHYRSTRPIVPPTTATLTPPQFIREQLIQKQPREHPINLEPQPTLPPVVSQVPPALPQPKSLPLLPPAAPPPTVQPPEPDTPPASWQTLAAQIQGARTSPSHPQGSAPSAPAEDDLIDLSHLFT